MPPDLGVYQPPKGEGVGSPAAPGRLYIAQQVAVATFLGGPLAGCVLLASNYGSLGRPAARIQAIAWGIAGSAVMLAVAAVLPDSFPNSVLPIAYTAALYSFAGTTQGAEFQARIEAQGRQPYWKAIGIGLACLVALIIPILLYVLYFTQIPNQG